jgi:hypothetical protein
MTDANYLQALKGPLKRAAIDAYMKSEGWVVPGDANYPHYEDSDPDGQDTVTMPDKDGNGGGNWQSGRIREWIWNGHNDSRFHAAFDQVRQRVDAALKPWEDIPDPTGFDRYLEYLRQANRELSASSSSSGGGAATGGGSLGGNLTIIQENSTAMSGAMITAFKSRFLLQLSNAIGGHHGLTVILGQALAGEQNLMKETRADVAEAVTKTTQALEAYAHGGSSDASFVFKVAGAVVAGVSAFVSGGATVYLSGAAAGLTLLTTVADHEEKAAKEPSQQDYAGLMDGLQTALDDINNTIKREEGLIRDNLTRNLHQVQADEASYNLTNPIQNISDDSQLDEGPGRAIIHDRSLVAEITGTAMPAIADELGKAQNDVLNGWSGTPYYRDPSIGLGETGPYPQWENLVGPLWRLISDLEWEVRNGAKTLELAIEDMGRIDTDAQDALEKHAASISGYQNYQIPK